MKGEGKKLNQQQIGHPRTQRAFDRYPGWGDPMAGDGDWLFYLDYSAKTGGGNLDFGLQKNVQEPSGMVILF
jgi:hypothetical protein